MPRNGKPSTGAVCALVSGGVESAALLARFLSRGDVVQPVYIASGYRWEKAERRWLSRLLAAMAHPRLRPLCVLEAPARSLSGAEHWGFSGRGVPGARSDDAAVNLPGRNILLLSAAALFCSLRSIEVIALGTLEGNPFPDATPAFFSRLARAAALGLGCALRIETPFRRMTKDRVISRSGALPWHLTFSCLSPRGLRPCLRCNKCAERGKVLRG